VSADVRTGDQVMLTPSGIGHGRDLAVAPTARAADARLMRFRANGSETSVVRGDMRDDFLDPDSLFVKRDLPVPDEENVDRVLWAKDRRALIAFELERLEGRQATHATLRLNMVPSDRGYASLLPERTRIEVYGIRDVPALESWNAGELKWADAPGSVGDGTDVDGTEVGLLGSFEIERGYLEGPVVFESAELTRFVNEDRTGVVGFVLVPVSMPQEPWSLVHAFASSHHAEAAGPSLEIHAR